MVTCTALQKFETRSASTGNLCVGLDPDPARLPAVLGDGVDGVRRFCLEIIAATSPFAAAFKPNAAFFEIHGAAGWAVLGEVIAAVPPQIPIILDAKRGDIGNSARFYAQAAFGTGADAITVSPYLGRDAIQPFVDHRDRMTFVLASTSNPGAADFQDIADTSGEPLYARVARLASSMHLQPGAVGLVAGATRPEALANIRAAAPELWLLLPGIGAQGGDLARVAPIAGRRALFNASREILFASAGSDFPERAALAAQNLRDELGRHL